MTEEITFKVPDYSVYTGYGAFQYLNYDAQMYLYYLLGKGKDIEYYSESFKAWMPANNFRHLAGDQAYRPAPKDDDVHWPSMPHDWVVKGANGKIFNCQFEPDLNKESNEWIMSGWFFEICHLLTTKDNGKHWTESKQEKPEEFKSE